MYKHKYIKYKNKYLQLNKSIINQCGGAFATESDLLVLFKNEPNKLKVYRLLNENKYDKIQKIIDKQNWDMLKKSQANSIISQIKLPDEMKITILKQMEGEYILDLIKNPVNKETYRLVHDYDLLKDISFDYSLLTNLPDNMKSIICKLHNVNNVSDDLYKFTRLQVINFSPYIPTWEMDYSILKNLPNIAKSYVKSLCEANETKKLNMFTNLKIISFTEEFNENINNMLPISIEHICLGSKFNNSSSKLNLSNLVNLKSFQIGSDDSIFDQNINNSLPISLVMLEILGQFNNNNSSIDLTNLTNLETINLGDNFNQNINYKFPLSIKTINLGQRFNNNNEPLNINNLVNLEMIYFDDKTYYNNNKQSIVLPSNPTGTEYINGGVKLVF